MNASGPGIEGQLSFRLTTRNGRVEQVAIESSRPLAAARLFEGRRVDEALALVPRLYSVCGTAQTRTAVKAAFGAQQRAEAAHIADARDLLVWVETAREHGLRILMDWAAYLGQQASRQVARLPDIAQQFQHSLFGDGAAFLTDSQVRIDSQAFHRALRELRELLETGFFGRPAASWRAINDPEELKAWATDTDTIPALLLRQVRREGMSGLGGSTTGFMPKLDAETLRNHLTLNAVERFIANPEWDGSPRETGCLSRCQGHPLIRALRMRHGNALLTRLAARLVELAEIPVRLENGFETLGLSNETIAQGGLAQVEAVRGRLVHHVVVSKGRIDRYRILAPTEWNFHPRGCAAQALTGLTFEDRGALEQQTDLLIKAIDPCVGYSLEVTHA